MNLTAFSLLKLTIAIRGLIMSDSYIWIKLLLFLSSLSASYLMASSQAYNHSSGLHADVNIATGSFHFEYPVISNQGRIAPFTLMLSYRYNRKGRFGLPEGWQFDLNHVDGKNLNLSGQQWTIDPTWHDETLYASGLKYQNQHGIAFNDHGEATAIPHYPKLTYRYVLAHKDGSLSYFSEQGLLVLSLDRFNNALRYEYNEPISSMNDARIHKIVDNYGQVYQFAYDPGAITITYPDKRSLVIYHQAQGVKKVVNPLGQSIDISYTEHESATLLKTLKAPSGLLMSLTYSSIPAKSSGSTTNLPVVASFSHHDLEQNKDLMQKHYTYSASKNFTGYPDYEQGGESDNLFDSHDEAYRYNVSVEESNLEATPLFRTRHFTYNYLHLPVEVFTHYQGKPHTKATYTYAISPFKYSQSTNFDKPETITQHLWDDTENKWLERTQARHEYDLFGNLTKTERSVFQPSANHWILVSTKTSDFYTDHYSLPKASSHQDNINGLTIHFTYSLSTDYKTLTLHQSHFQDLSTSSDWQPYQQTLTQHDEQGRLISSTLSWLAPNKPGEQSVTIKTAFHEDLNNHQLHVSESNGLGETHQKCYDLRNNQYISFHSPEGDAWHFQYDALGRLTKTIDPRQHEWEQRYTDFSSNGFNSIEHVSPLDYRKRAHYDALHRPTKHEDWYQQSWRSLSTLTHNGFGQVVESANHFGLSHHYAYDGEGRLLSAIDPSGNQETFLYDDSKQLVTTYLNGIKQRESELLPWQLTNVMRHFANPSNSLDQQSHFLQVTDKYNAFGQPMEKNIAEVNLSTHQLTTQTNHKFSYAGGQQPTTINTTTSEGETLTQTHHYDLFNNRTFSSNTLKALGAQAQHQSETHHFDRANRLVKVESQLDEKGRPQTTAFQWNKDGHKIQTFLPNGNTIDYQYRPGGLLSSSSWQRNGKSFQVTRNYDEDGRLIAISDQIHKPLTFSYLPSGLLTHIQYPDGFKITVNYDRFNQQLSSSDSEGFHETFMYNTPHRPDQLTARQLGPHQVRYTYGQDENGHKGQLIQREIINGSAHSNTLEKLHYGALGLLSRIDLVSESAGIKTYTQLMHDSKRRLTQVDTQLNQSHHQASHQRFAYTYDGLNRLQKETFLHGDNTLSREYRYDANHNVVRELIHSNNTQFDKHYHYNRRDQLIAITYDQETPKALHYSINGHLIKDEQDTTYQFDDRGFLLNMNEEKDSARHFDYWPNGLLSTINGKQSTQAFYYNSKQQLASLVQKQGPNYIIHAGKGLLLSSSEKGLSQLSIHHSNASIFQSHDLRLQGLAYSAFGSPLQDKLEDPLTQFAWKQAYRDSASGLVYMTSRYHQPHISQFISQDNYLVSNRYVFAQGNPIYFSDPLGHNPSADSRSATYGSGAILVVLGIFGAVYSIPTGGASLTLTAGAGIAAGVSTVISGGALMGMQGAMDSGNKKAADILKYISTGFGVVAAIDIGVAIAPKIPSILSSLSSAVNKLADNAATTIANWSTHAAESDLPGSMAASSGHAIPSPTIDIPSKITEAIASSSLKESFSSAASSMESSYASVHSSASWLNEGDIGGVLGEPSEAENTAAATNEIDDIRPNVKKVRFSSTVRVREYDPGPSSVSGSRLVGGNVGRTIDAGMYNAVRAASRGARVTSELVHARQPTLQDEIIRLFYHGRVPSHFSSLAPQ